jgi:hypothetical protein
MASTTVTGRVRATVRLKDGGAGIACVIASSWASDRAFPRTHGTAVAFELQTGDGEVFRVDPFEALVTLPVRSRALREGVRHEEGWIANEDEITVEGELERAGRARQAPALRARRIAVGGTTTQHRLPPRSLRRGEYEKLEVVVAPVTILAVIPVPAEAPAPGAETPAPGAESPALGADTPVPGAVAPSDAAEASAEPAAARRPKKKRPDSSGTPTPVQ